MLCRYYGPRRNASNQTDVWKWLWAQSAQLSVTCDLWLLFIVSSFSLSRKEQIFHHRWTLTFISFSSKIVWKQSEWNIYNDFVLKILFSIFPFVGNSRVVSPSHKIKNHKPESERRREIEFRFDLGYKALLLSSSTTS